MAASTTRSFKLICDPGYFRFCELVFADHEPVEGDKSFPKNAVQFGFAWLSDSEEVRRMYRRARRKLLKEHPLMEGVLCRLEGGGAEGALVDETGQATGLKGYRLDMKLGVYSPAEAVPSRKPLREVSLDF